MIVESDGSGGWFIGNVDGLNASIHLTEAWLTEYERHHGPQHRMRALLRRADPVTATDVRAVLENRYTKTRGPKGDQALRDWRKAKRENRRQVRS